MYAKRKGHGPKIVKKLAFRKICLPFASFFMQRQDAMDTWGNQGISGKLDLIIITVSFSVWFYGPMTCYERSGMEKSPHSDPIFLSYFISYQALTESFALGQLVFLLSFKLALLVCFQVSPGASLSKQRISTHPPDELSALYPSRNVQKAFSGHLSLLWLSSFKNFLVLEIYLVSYLFMYKY